MAGRSSRASGLLALAFVLSACVCGVRAFYIPGVAPTEYAEGEKLEIKVSVCLFVLMAAKGVGDEIELE